MQAMVTGNLQLPVILYFILKSQLEIGLPSFLLRQENRNKLRLNKEWIVDWPICDEHQLPLLYYFSEQDACMDLIFDFLKILAISI